MTSRCCSIRPSCFTAAADPDLIGDVIRRPHEGGRWIDHDILKASVIDDSPLTEREIAARLHEAPGTVRNYLSSAMQKTHTASRQDSARHARARGWL